MLQVRIGTIGRIAFAALLVFDLVMGVWLVARYWQVANHPDLLGYARLSPQEIAYLSLIWAALAARVQFAILVNLVAGLIIVLSIRIVSAPQQTSDRAQAQAVAMPSAPRDPKASPGRPGTSKNRFPGEPPPDMQR